jgi:hypothetical protein
VNRLASAFVRVLSSLRPALEIWFLGGRLLSLDQRLGERDPYGAPRGLD